MAKDERKIEKVEDIIDAPEANADVVEEEVKTVDNIEETEEEVNEEMVQAIAKAIAEEATETDKTIEDVVNDIIEESNNDESEETQGDLIAQSRGFKNAEHAKEYAKSDLFIKLGQCEQNEFNEWLKNLK